MSRIERVTGGLTRKLRRHGSGFEECGGTEVRRVRVERFASGAVCRK